MDLGYELICYCCDICPFSMAKNTGKLYHLQYELKNCVHSALCVCAVFAKVLEFTQKNVHTYFHSPLIFKILVRCFTKILYYCFIGTSFLVQFWLCGNTRVMSVQFAAMFVFKC